MIAFEGSQDIGRRCEGDLSNRCDAQYWPRHDRRGACRRHGVVHAYCQGCGAFFLYGHVDHLPQERVPLAGERAAFFVVCAALPLDRVVVAVDIAVYNTLKSRCAESPTYIAVRLRSTK